MNMETVFKHINGFVGDLTSLLIAFLSLAVVGQILFGQTIFGMDVIGNVVGVIDSLGQSGFVGIVALLVLYSLFNKK
tara:strand:- start:10705 stop:10935 length:231 start_codon:yes stop_codon:yes gene_type:complete